MPHWLQTTVEVVGGVSLLAGAAWRYIYRPGRQLAGWLRRWAEDVRGAAAANRQLALDVRALAGAVVRLTFDLFHDVRDNRSRIRDLEGWQHDVATELTDLQADIGRLLRQRRRRDDPPLDR